jgi:hypothetical protein
MEADVPQASIESCGTCRMTENQPALTVMTEVEDATKALAVADIKPPESRPPSERR